MFRKHRLLLTTIFMAGLAFLFPRAAASAGKPMTLYVGEGCGHCAEVEQFIETGGYGQSCSIEVKEIYFDKGNAQELTNLFEQHKVPLMQRGVPTLLAEDELYIGGSKIKDYLSGIEVQNTCPPGERTSLLLPALVAGAFVDSINPCAFAVLVLLLTTILAASEMTEGRSSGGWIKRLVAGLMRLLGRLPVVGSKIPEHWRYPSAKGNTRVLQAGLLFASAIFLSYLAMGLGLYKALTVGKLPDIFMRGVAIVAILFGLFNLKDYFWYGKAFVMEVPVSWRPKMKRIIRSVTSPLGAFLIGFVISLFLLPCTSGPYIVVLGMLSQRTYFTRALLYLVLYNLIFIAPMVLITLAVYKGLSPEKVEEVRQKRIKQLHLVAGAILIVMGLVILAGWV